MAKLYLIKISDSKENIENCTFTQRFVEITCLKEFLKLYGTKQGDFEKYFSVKETIDSLPDIEGDETEIKFDKEQLGFLKESFGLSAGNRTALSDEHCSSLYKQIWKPEEIDV